MAHFSGYSGSIALSRKKPNKFFFFFILMLYPVMPLNYYVGPLSYANFCGLLLFASFFIFRLNRFHLVVFKEDWPFWQYLLIYTLFNFATASPLNGLAWLCAYLLANVAIILSIENSSDLYKAIDGLICVGVLLGLLGIAESISGKYFIQNALMERTDGSAGLRYGVLRSTGPFGTPINFGIYMAISSILITYRLSTNISKDYKKVLYVSYLPLLLGMFLSVSRLAICVFVAAHAILLYSMGVRKSLSIIAGVLLIIAIVTALADLFGIDLSVLTKALSDFFSSFLALFSGDQQSSSSNVVGFGNRFDLYKWVIDFVGKNWLTGLGVKAEFSKVLNPWTTKTSVEVNYLYIYLQCGIIGLFSLILFYIGNITYISKYRKIRISGENRFGFAETVYIIIILYYISLFGVQETDLARVHFLLISLVISYQSIYRHEVTEGGINDYKQVGSKERVFHA